MFQTVSRSSNSPVSIIAMKTKLLLNMWPGVSHQCDVELVPSPPDLCAMCWNQTRGGRVELFSATLLL